jgi:hypothetical protein
MLAQRHVNLLCSLIREPFSSVNLNHSQLFLFASPQLPIGTQEMRSIKLGLVGQQAKQFLVYQII